MKNSLIFIFLFVANIFCDDAHEDFRLENKAIETTNNQHNSPLLSEINDSISPENPLAVKQKRCPKLRFSSPLLGASISTKAEKDDNKNKLYSALCKTCLLTNKCSSVNECPLCQKWCTTSRNCKEDDDKNKDKDEDETVSLGTRGNFNTEENKSKVRSITLTRGNLMEIILSLFGIYDAKDVESVTVTVKSSGDNPIELSEKDLQEQAEGGKLEKKLKDLGAIGRKSEVNENPIDRDKLHELVTEILGKLHSRDISPLKGNELDDDEIPQVGSRMSDVESRDKIIHQSMSNPDIIEDSPDMARISSNSGLLASPSKHQENLGASEEDKNDTKNPTLGASLDASPDASPSSNLDSTQDIQLKNRNNDDKLRDPFVPPHHIHHPHHIHKPKIPQKPHIPHKLHIPHHPPHFTHPSHFPPHFHRSNEPISNPRFAPDSYQNFYPRYASETSEPFQRPDMPVGNPRYIPDGSQNFYRSNDPAGNLRYAPQYYDNTVGTPYNPNNQAFRSSVYNYPDNFVGQPFYSRQPEVDSRLGNENPQVSNHLSPVTNSLPPNPFAYEMDEEVTHKEQDPGKLQAVSEAAKKPKIGAARSSEPVKVDVMDKQTEPKKAIGFKASEMMRKLKERQDQTMQRFEEQKSRLRENADKVTKTGLKEDIPKTIASKAASKTKKTGEDVVGSQPLENFFQRMQPDNTFLHRPWSNLKNASPSKNPESNIGVERRVGSPTPNLSSRSHLEDESNALGSDISYKNPSDIFFVGNGVKLPLQMVKKSDGAVHLAVDMGKLCTSCHNNRTAKELESTVGTILEKEAELKDQLKDITRKQRNHEGSEFVNIKNRIANGYKDGSSLKRSIKDDQKLPNFLKDIVNEDSKKGSLGTVRTAHSIFNGKTLEDTNENLIPISSSYKFEGLEEDLAKKLKNIEKTVENYSKIDDKIFENESEILNKFNDDNPLVQKEIELASDLLGFFKKLAVDATKQGF